MKFRFSGLWACLGLVSVCMAKPQSYTAKKGDTHRKRSSHLNFSTKSTYTVREVDNDYTIARKFGMSLSALHQLNPNVNWDRLRPGSKVVVSESSSDSRPSTSSIPVVLKAGQAEIIKDNVMVRSKPSLNGGKLTMAEEGQITTVLAKEHGWSKLRLSNGETGWVRNDMIRCRQAPGLLAKKSEGNASNKQRLRYQPKKSEPAKNVSQKYLAYNNTSGAHSSGSSVVDSARSYLGVRYRWTGMSRSGFDCSGLTTRVYQQHGVHLPHSSRNQARTGAPVRKAELQKGDLVFFKTRGRRTINHVGIYAGNGKFIHASSGKHRVRVDSLNDGYYASRFAGARRVAKKRHSSEE